MDTAMDVTEDEAPHRLRLDRMKAGHAAVVKKYEISSAMAERLHALRNYEIVLVCDDSGSMNTPLADYRKTRWHQLCEIVKLVVEVGVIFDLRGLDLYFLNREPVFKVKDPAQVDQIFQNKPRGFTPLVPVLRQIFKLPPTRAGHDKKLLVFIATDGAPTDVDGTENIAELENLLDKERQIARTFVHFLACTDDSYYMNYLEEWDRNMENVDVTGEYRSEVEKIRRYRGLDYPFSFGDYVVKALVGAIDPVIDGLNE